MSLSVLLAGHARVVPFEPGRPWRAGLATAVGESRDTNPDGSLRDLYYNHWTLRFDDDGRCVDFVEYYMALPARLHAGH